MRLPAVPPSTQKPSAPDDYPGTLIDFDETPEERTYDGVTRYSWKTVWKLDGFTDDIWIWINVSSRHAKGNLFKLHVAMEGKPPPPDDEDIEVDHWRNRRAIVCYDYGVNPKDPKALGVAGFRRLKQQPAPQPQRRPAPPPPVEEDPFSESDPWDTGDAATN